MKEFRPALAVLFFCLIATLLPYAMAKDLTNLDGIYIPSGSCPTTTCCCSNGLPTTISSSPLTDEIIVSTEFGAQVKCNGFQSFSAVFSVIDGNSALWVAPITKIRWQLKWNNDFTIIQLQQLNSDNSIETSCLNQLKRFTSTDEITDMSRADISTFDMISSPASALTFSTNSFSNEITIPASQISDKSHQIVVQVVRVGKTNRFDFNVYLQFVKGGTDPVKLNTQALINADFVTLHYITPTTLSSDTALMATRTKLHLTPINQGGNNALFYRGTVRIVEQTGIRFALTYKFSTIQSISGVSNTQSAYNSKTVFFQNNNPILSTSAEFTTTSGRVVNAVTMEYVERFKPDPSLLADGTSTNGSSSTSTPTTPGSTGSSGTPKPTPNTGSSGSTTTTTPKPTTPADQRELLAGDWKSTGSCKSSPKCCCLSPTKPVAMTVYTPEQAKTKGIDVEGIDVKNKNQIVVVGYPDSHPTCFGITELKGLCTINFSTKKGTCKMNGVDFTSSVDSNNQLHVENSMFEDCESIATKIQ